MNRVPEGCQPSQPPSYRPSYPASHPTSRAAFEGQDWWVSAQGAAGLGARGHAGYGEEERAQLALRLE